MNKEVIGGICGTSVSAVGTASQTNEILQTISLIITILGAVITTIMAIMNWWKKAKADGKITKEEIHDGIDIIMGGAEDIKDKLKKDKEEDK